MRAAFRPVLVSPSRAPVPNEYCSNEGEGIMDYAEVQIEDYSGNWVTVSNVENNLQRIGYEMRSVQSRYQDRRVRAIGKDGRLIDML